MIGVENQKMLAFSLALLQQQLMFVYNQNFLFIFAWPNHKKSNISPT